MVRFWKFLSGRVNQLPCRGKGIAPYTAPESLGERRIVYRAHGDTCCDHDNSPASCPHGVTCCPTAILATLQALIPAPMAILPGPCAILPASATSFPVLMAILPTPCAILVPTATLPAVVVIAARVVMDEIDNPPRTQGFGSCVWCDSFPPAGGLIYKV